MAVALDAFRATERSAAQQPANWHCAPRMASFREAVTFLCGSELQSHMAIPSRGNAPGQCSTADNVGAPTESSTSPRPSVLPCGDTQDAALAATDPGADESAKTASQAGAMTFPVVDWEKYEFLSLVGRGGMGAVYKARDRQLGRIAALKFIRGDSPTLGQRFLQEAHAQARLDHPNICRVYEVGQVEGKPYIAMEFVEGMSLSEARHKLSLYDKVQVIRDAALALHEAHRIGIIHRDIKSANIMVQRREDGSFRAVVMDFGLARDTSESRDLTQTGAVMGTPAYMPPEQARGNGRHLDRRSDVYSIGATLYELLTGRPPFSGPEVVDLLLAVLHDDPKSPRSMVPSVPVDLETIVLKCLAKEPELRYDSMRALANDLQCYIDGEPIAGRRSTLRYRLRRYVRRHRALVVVGTIAALVSVTLGGIGIRTEIRARQRAQLAQQLGQDIRDMELFMRFGYALPTHDIRREQAVVRAKMDGLSARLKTANRESGAALHYGLGRGHLVLRQYADAQRELQIALQAGYESESLRTALGLALGERYRQELTQAKRFGNKQWIAQRDQELTTEFLHPALKYLRDDPQGVESPLYVKGLLAFYQQQHESALALAKQAQAETPWLADPLVLEGDVYHAQAQSILLAGKWKEARDLLLLAVARHRAAASISRSDGRVYEAEANDWVRVMEAEAQSGAPVLESWRAASEAAEHMMTTNPQLASGATLKAWANWRFGKTKLLRGEDAKQPLETALESAQAAIKLSPNDWQAIYFYSLVLSTLADLPGSPADVRTKLQSQSSTALRRTIELNPNSTWAWHDLGHRLLSTLEDKILHGAFDEALVTEVESCFMKAAQSDPKHYPSQMGLLSMYSDKVLFQYNHGQSIERDTALALEAEKQALSLNKSDSFIHALGFTVRMYHAEYLSWSAEVPAQILDQLSKKLSLLQAAEAAEGVEDVYAPHISVLRAANDLHAGRDPRPAIAEGLGAILQIRKKEPSLVSLFTAEAALHLLAGRFAGVHSAEAQQHWQRAVTAAQQAVALGPDEADAHARLCESLRYAASVTASQPRRAADKSEHAHPVSERGVKACAAALAINPTLAVAYANRGALLTQQAQWETNPTLRGSLAHSAQESIEQALAINKWRQKEWQPLLDAAKSVGR